VKAGARSAVPNGAKEFSREFVHRVDEELQEEYGADVTEQFSGGEHHLP
jgi:hypothetical protein